MNKQPIDITNDTDTRANTLLCGFDETVVTKGGQIKPDGLGFLLTPTTGKPRKFNTASGALEVLRRLTKNQK